MFFWQLTNSEPAGSRFSLIPSIVRQYMTNSYIFSILKCQSFLHISTKNGKLYDLFTKLTFAFSQKKSFKTTFILWIMCITRCITQIFGIFRLKIVDNFSRHIFILHRTSSRYTFYLCILYIQQDAQEISDYRKMENGFILHTICRIWS